MSSKVVEIYPVCQRFLNPAIREKIPAGMDTDAGPDDFVHILSTTFSSTDLPPFLADLARIEWAMYQASIHAVEEAPTSAASLAVNPTLFLFEVSWRGLPGLLGQKKDISSYPQPGTEYILVWRHAKTEEVTVRAATREMLLALKIIGEELDIREVAEKENITLAKLDLVLDRAVETGILLKSPSLLVRDSSVLSKESEVPDRFRIAQVFTLQWHITQACDLHCRHCYDRSSGLPLTLEAGLSILDEFRDFCRSRHVSGQVSFTGGNPLLHPHFLELYQAAVDRGLMTAILGNPAERKMLDRIRGCRRPEFYQVSLEGLQEHNDYIRGAGHFDRVLAFLDELKNADIYSMVMLTLTRGNLDQVLPLAEVLRDRTDLFTFNRLSMVGEGARLQTPLREEYQVFLMDYLRALEKNPTMALKDNLINILLEQKGEKLFGGCAGFGCGAAFNFVALLPDGAVHACRKFPSLIGNINTQSLAAIYDSETAARYRRGPESCRGCRIRHVCGGCLAVAYSHGLDIFSECDPCCFIEAD